MKKEEWDTMIDTEQLVKMIKEQGVEYFTKDKKQKVKVGLYLEYLMEQRHITRKEMISKLNVDESYGRKLFGGQRTPTRKILIQSAFILGLNLEETQRILEIGQKARLYPRIRYDAAIIYGLEKKLTLDKMNSFLEEIGETALL